MCQKKSGPFFPPKKHTFSLEEANLCASKEGRRASRGRYVYMYDTLKAACVTRDDFNVRKVREKRAQTDADAVAPPLPPLSRTPARLHISQSTNMSNGRGREGGVPQRTFDALICFVVSFAFFFLSEEILVLKKERKTRRGISENPFSLRGSAGKSRAPRRRAGSDACATWNIENALSQRYVREYEAKKEQTLQALSLSLSLCTRLEQRQPLFGIPHRDSQRLPPKVPNTPNSKRVDAASKRRVRVANVAVWVVPQRFLLKGLLQHALVT